jgi:hypothetical protein
MARKRASSPEPWRPTSHVQLEGSHAKVLEPGKKVRLVIEGTVSSASVDPASKHRSASVQVHRVRQEHPRKAARPRA